MEETNIIKITKTEIEATVRRRNELIMAKFFRLSLQANRLFLFVLSQVRDEHNEDTEYEFSVNEVANAIGIDRSNLYKSMVNALDELARTMVDLPVLDDEGKPLPDRVVRVGLIKNRQHMRIAGGGEKRVEGAVTVSIYKELLPYVHKLKARYTEVELKYVLRLSSSYSQRLYDLLKSRAFIAQPWRVERAELRKLLAIEDGKFELWGDFRRYVLEKAQEEINAATDLAFDLSDRRTGRTVAEVVFTLRKEGGSNVKFMPGTFEHQTFKGMLDLGMLAKEADNVMKEWWASDPERLRWHLAEVRKKMASGKVRNALGWFRSGIRKDFREQRTLFASMKEKADRKRVEYRSAGNATGEGLKKEFVELYRQMGEN
jgi:plasmid replication initiation protein